MRARSRGRRRVSARGARTGDVDSPVAAMRHWPVDVNCAENELQRMPTGPPARRAETMRAPMSAPVKAFPSKMATESALYSAETPAMLAADGGGGRDAGGQAGGSIASEGVARAVEDVGAERGARHAPPYCAVMWSSNCLPISVGVDMAAGRGWVVGLCKRARQRLRRRQTRSTRRVRRLGGLRRAEASGIAVRRSGWSACHAAVASSTSLPS